LLLRVHQAGDCVERAVINAAWRKSARLRRTGSTDRDALSRTDHRQRDDGDEQTPFE
jgi:hypothetical protein